MDAIRGDDVLRVLFQNDLWNRKPTTARRVRQQIRTVLSWGRLGEFVKRNVAGEAIDGALPKRRRRAKSHRALPHAEVRELLATVEGSRSRAAVRLCLRFLILTAARSGEARGARWSEIDVDNRTWTLSGERMKAGKEHRVPLGSGSSRGRGARPAVAEPEGVRTGVPRTFGGSGVEGHGADERAVGGGGRRAGDGSRVPLDVQRLERAAGEHADAGGGGACPYRSGRRRRLSADRPVRRAKAADGRLGGVRRGARPTLRDAAETKTGARRRIDRRGDVVAVLLRNDNRIWSSRGFLTVP